MRKIKRNIFKNQIGSNKIGSKWHSMQIKKYGIIGWTRMYIACNWH